MNNIDGRRLSDAIREEIRFKAIQEWNEGVSPTNLARKYGTSRKIGVLSLINVSLRDYEQ